MLGGGLINLKIEPEVSQLDLTNTITVASTVLPSLIVRRTNTTIELRDGQSFAIAGLLQNTIDTTAEAAAVDRRRAGVGHAVPSIRGCRAAARRTHPRPAKEGVSCGAALSACRCGR